MKFAKYFLILLFPAVATAQTAEGYTTTANGLHYKFLRRSATPQYPGLTDIVSLNLTYSLRKKEGDSLMFDTRNIPQQELMVQLQPPAYRGDLMEGLAMAGVGDSISLIVPADSFFIRTAGVPNIPAHFSGASLIFQVGVKKVQTFEEIQKLQAQQDSIFKSQEESMRSQELAELKSYLDANNIKVAPRESGLIIIPGKKGGGAKPAPGSQVTVHYTGKLLDGSKFDSSVDRGDPFTFTLGRGMVIAGWDEGIAQLEVGSTATLIIPSSIGYGARGAGNAIPPFSTLIFEVELLKAE